MKLLIITAMVLVLSGCGDNPFNDYSKIPDTDYAQIRIEIERCSHVSKEGSFLASMRFSANMECLNHLKERIVHTGKATPEMYK